MSLSRLFSLELRTLGNPRKLFKMYQFLEVGVGWQDVARTLEDWLSCVILLSSRQGHTTDLSFCPACRRLTSSCGFHR